MLLKLTESFDPDTVVVAFDKGRPAFRIEALARNTAFLAVYLDARDKFAKGSRDVVFPAGTWGLRRYVNVQCSEATPARAPE